MVNQDERATNRRQKVSGEVPAVAKARLKACTEALAWGLGGKGQMEDNAFRR